MQLNDGSWPYRQTGMTSLAGLTLLECGGGANDPAVEKAAAYVRDLSPTMSETYSIALAIVFLDRLGDARDVPLIESLTVRLLAGQGHGSGWSYFCPAVAEAEVTRLRGLIKARNELKGGRELPKGKRTTADLPKEIQQHLTNINRVAPPQGGPGGAPLPGAGMSDNSNTQFATLALWVGRRHGLPVDSALARIDTRYRRGQSRDGTWDYFSAGVQPMGGAFVPATAPPSAAMTCSALIGLAVAHGVSHDPDRKKGQAPLDPARDPVLQKGLLALGTAIGAPGGQAPRIGGPNGKAYYFLWSLERVAMALNLETIDKKDWYSWGAEILIANQDQQGSWMGGEYSEGGADTCFALLFLRRSNLVKDLSTSLKGQLKDPALETTLKGGLRPPGSKPLKSAFAPEDKKALVDPRTKEQPKMKPLPSRSENTEVEDLSKKLLEAKGEDRAKLLKEYTAKTGKNGDDYTEALAVVIPRMQGDDRSSAREALATRMTRLSARQLARDLKDPDAEIRAAAVVASEAKELREHIPLIIDKLDDLDPYVVRAALTVLKKMTKQDFGPERGATREEHDKAVKEWKAWWENEKK